MAGSDTNKDEDILEGAKSEFDRATDAWSENYNEALDDFRFARLHEHWPEKIRKQRELEGRPCLSIPLLPAFIRQVVNDARQSKPSITVSAADSKADPKTAEIFNGLIRQIERDSHADVAYDTGIEHTSTGGFGYLKVNTKYCGDDSFEQDLVIEAVPNCFSILPDPDSKAADSSDWNVAFEVDTLRKPAFEKRWPEADAVSFEGKGNEKKVADGEAVQIAYQWVRSETTRKIMALKPTRPLSAEESAELGETLPETMIIEVGVYRAQKALFDALGFEPVGQARDVASHKVEQRILSGADVLETVDWAGKWIPIIPIYGCDINIEGRRYLEGLVRPAKDEQRRYNFHMTSATESTALAPKTPFIGRAGQFVTDADKWATANSQTWAYIEYDDETGAGPPQRQGYAGVPIGDFQMAQSASDSIKSITGIHNASLGQASNETSGKAILARQREGDVGSFHYVDNLSRAIRHTGEIMLDLIPKVYGTARIIRILGPDDKVAQVKINQPTTIQEKAEGGQLQDIEHIYDMTAGKYDLVVKAGPSFNTKREEFVALVIEIIRSFPAAAPVLMDLVVKNYDLPDAEKVVERLEALLPAQLKGESPEAQEMKAQLQKMAQIIGQLKGQLAAANADKSHAERELDIDGYNAETNRLKAIIPKGTTYDPQEMGAVVMTSLLHIIQSPDILEAVQAGADPQALGQMLAQRMAPKPDDGSGGAPPSAMAA